MKGAGNIFERTSKALPAELLHKINNVRLCILGCGATGSTFAEIMARTGVVKFFLVDYDRVDASNLNRTFSFVRADIGEYKTVALKRRLLSINPDVDIETKEARFGPYIDHDLDRMDVRRMVLESDIVYIAMDNNRSRVECERLLRGPEEHPDRCYLSVGIAFDDGKGTIRWECTWKPNTPQEEGEGYGPENASCASVVLEATAISATMLLHHLANNKSRNFRQMFRKYENFSLAEEEMTSHEQ